MSQNEFSHIPTKLVPKLSGELAAQEYAIHFENGGNLATLEQTSSSRRPGIATFVEQVVTGNRKISCNIQIH